MNYPKLVPESLCRTPCKVVIFSENINEDGAPETAFSGELKCLFQSDSKRVRTEKHDEVTLTGFAYFSVDFSSDSLDGQRKGNGHNSIAVVSTIAGNKLSKNRDTYLSSDCLAEYRSH